MATASGGIMGGGAAPRSLKVCSSKSDRMHSEIQTVLGVQLFYNELFATIYVLGYAPYKYGISAILWFPQFYSVRHSLANA